MKFFKIWMIRRTVQITVFLSLFMFPVVALYSHYLSTRQLDKLQTRWEGTFQGESLQLTDKVMRIGIPDGESGVITRRPRKAILARTQQIYGSVWSARVFKLSATDLLAGAESLVTSRTLTSVLLMSLLFPLIVTLLFGRVFCSWICPMGLVFELGQKFRSLIQFLEIKPFNVRFSFLNKYILLVFGLAFGYFVGLPLLQYLYPPALVSRESQGFVMTLFERAENGKLGLAFIGFTSISLFLFVLLAIDSFVAPRFWCRSICPGGAIYSLLGKFRLFRVRRNMETCTSCAECNIACPMALKPMIDKTGIECDNCGVCVDVCPEKSLGYKLSLKNSGFRPSERSAKASKKVENKEESKKLVPTGILLILAFVLSFGQQLHAHHIMGIPHYSYDENYPQAPVIKLVELVGQWEFQLTGYPGLPQPGKRTELHIYVADAKTKEIYNKPLKIYVKKQNLFGFDETIFGPVETELNENLFKFYPTYPTDGNYNITLEFQDVKGNSTLEFPLVVGEPGSPLMVLFCFLGGLLSFFIVIRAIRIKHARRLGTLKSVSKENS